MEGLAITVDPDVVFNPADGDHSYELAPLPVNVAELPEHIETLGEAVTVGNGLTVTVTVAVLVYPFASVPVTV